jgi:hypothetical protein
MKSKAFRHLTVLFLLMIMLICGTSLASAASYSDVAGTQYQTAVETLSAMGIVGGNPDGTFQPLRSVTRAEFSAMITRFLGIPDSTLADYTGTDFKDMRGYSWSIPYFGYCSEKGIITGDGKGNAMPGNTITYGQAVTMLVRTLGFESELGKSIGWPNNYIDVASKHGLTINVMASGENINRGNAAMLLYNALNSDSSYDGELTVNKLSLYRMVGGNLMETDKYARNLDSVMYVKFTLEHEMVDNDKIIPVELIISPTVEKKVIEDETKYIKLLAGTEITDVATSISIKDLVVDNPNVKQYKIEIKANNTILDLNTLELYVDTSEEEVLIDRCTMKSIKFFSGNSSDWIPYEDRVYAVSFLKTPVLTIIATEAVIEHEAAARDMVIPVTHVYYYGGNEWNKYTRDCHIAKGSTSTLIESGIYYSQFAAKKYQAGNYTVKTFAFGKVIAEGKFTIVTQ